MQQIEDKLSLFIKEQFPAFYTEEGETFRIFLEAYLNTSNSPVKASIIAVTLEYHDVDFTTDVFRWV